MKSNNLHSQVNPKKRQLIVIYSGVFCIAVDQILKFISHRSPEQTFYLIPNMVGWEYFENPGIAFGIPLPHVIVIPLTIAILVGALIFLGKNSNSTQKVLGTMLISAGALSNLIDRIVYAFTIDYIRIITSIINLADVYIILGTLILIKGSKKTDNTNT